MLGSWSDASGATASTVGETLEFEPTGGFAQVLRDAVRCVRNNNLPEDSLGRARGCSSTLIAPIMIDDSSLGRGRRWPRPTRTPSSAPTSSALQAFAEMLARIVTSLDERARLETEALTDQLTGLPNHRAVHQRLRADLCRGRAPRCAARRWR